MPEVCHNVSPGCRMLQNGPSSAPCALQAIALEPASAAPFVLVPERLPSEAMSAMDGRKPVGQHWTANLPCLDSEPCLSFSEAEHNGHNISVRHIGFQFTGGASGDNSCQRMLRPLVQCSAQLMPKGSFDPTWISSILVSSPMC